MADGVELHLDYGAVGARMRDGEMQSLILATAHGVAASITGASRVFVDAYVSDRAGATITVVDHDALELERISGRLANAARSAGLDVTIRG